jgi:hypothetical protein
LVLSRGTEGLKPVPSAAEPVSPTLSAAACEETLPLRPSVACEEISVISCIFPRNIMF